jgi:uncharacterized protein YndB with AHSA1/START domain
MVIQDKVLINASPEQVWTVISDPELVPLWNKKATDIVIISSGDPRPGYKYRISYVMSKKKTEMRAEIVEYDKPSRLLNRMEEKNQEDLLSTRRWMEEVYLLTEKNGGTLLEQKIIVHNSGINIFFRCLIWLITKLGKPTGKKYLVELKELVESR